MTTTIVLTAIIIYLIIGIFVYAFADLFLRPERLKPLPVIFTWCIFLIVLYLDKKLNSKENKK